MRSRVKHQQIVDHLRARIAGGALKTGDRLPSFEHLHRQFGAASKTVGRAIDVLEVDGLIERRRRSGVYVSCRIPLNERKRIALHGAGDANLGTDYWARFLNGAHSAARQIGAELALPVNGDEVRWDQYSGLVTVGEIGRPSLLSRPTGFPVVSVSDSTPGFATLGINEFDAGAIAANHLVELGHRRIGYLSWVASSIDMQRLGGYRYALKESDIPYDEELVRPMTHNVETPTLGEAGRHSIREWLEHGFADLHCTALIVQNDWAAVGAIKGLADRGFRVPGDISVVGFDNERDCATMTPSLTSISADMYELGFQSVMRLGPMLDKEPLLPTTTLLPATLYARDSTAPRQS